MMILVIEVATDVNVKKKIQKIMNNKQIIDKLVIAEAGFSNFFGDHNCR